MAFDDKAKARLAKAILSGKDDDANLRETSVASTEGVPGGASSDFDGEHDGNIRIEAADNGMIVKHDRTVKRPGNKKPGGGDSPVSHDNYEHKSYARVFASNDHKGMTDHIAAIIKSPMRKRGY